MFTARWVDVDFISSEGRIRISSGGKGKREEGRGLHLEASSGFLRRIQRFLRCSLFPFPPSPFPPQRQRDQKHRSAFFWIFSPRSSSLRFRSLSNDVEPESGSFDRIHPFVSAIESLEQMLPLID